MFINSKNVRLELQRNPLKDLIFDESLDITRGKVLNSLTRLTKPGRNRAREDNKVCEDSVNMVVIRVVVLVAILGCVEI